MARARYRTRTHLRKLLPAAVAERIPKGPKDCGEHEWYRSDENTWLCYHCEPGVTHTSPWTPAEEARLGEELAAVRAEAGLAPSDRTSIAH